MVELFIALVDLALLRDYLITAEDVWRLLELKRKACFCSIEWVRLEGKQIKMEDRNSLLIAATYCC